MVYVAINSVVNKRSLGDCVQACVLSALCFIVSFVVYLVWLVIKPCK